MKSKYPSMILANYLAICNVAAMVCCYSLDEIFLKSDNNHWIVIKDYKKSVCLGIIFLGVNFSIHALGAIFHVHWMAKVIHNSKIALY